MIISVLAVVSIKIWPLAEERAAKSYYPKLEFAISLLNLLQKDKANENNFYSPKSVYRSKSEFISTSRKNEYFAFLTAFFSLNLSSLNCCFLLRRNKVHVNSHKNKEQYKHV